MSDFYEYLNSLVGSKTPSKDLDYYQKIYGDTPFSVGNFTDNDAMAMWERYGVDSGGLLDYINSITDTTTQNSLYDLIGDRSTFSGYDPYNQNYQNTLTELMGGVDETWNKIDTSGDQWQGVPTDLLSDIYGGYLQDGSLYLPGDADLNSRLLMNPDQNEIELIKQFQNVGQSSGNVNPYYEVGSYDNDNFKYLPAEYIASGANKDGRGFASSDTAYIASNPELYAKNFREISSGMNDMSTTLGSWEGIGTPQKGYLLGIDDIKNSSDTLDKYMVGRNSDNLLLDNNYDPSANGGLRPQIDMGGISSKYDVQIDSNGKWRRVGRDGGSGKYYGLVNNTIPDGISGNTKMGDLGNFRGVSEWDNDTGGVLGKFGGILGTLLSFTPLAPLGYALQIGSAIENESLLQGLGAVVGMSGVLNGMSGIGDSFAAADAAQLANQGLSNAAIAQNLGTAYNMGSVASNTLAGLTSAGITSPIQQSIISGGMTGAINSGLSGGDLGQGILAGVTGSAIGNAINQVPIGSSGSGLVDAGINGVKGGVTNALTNTVLGNDVDFGNSIASGAVGGLTKNLMGQAISTAKPMVQDFFKNFGSGGDQLPSDSQLQELQFTNPDAYDWYMFGDEMGNTDQTDYSFMTNPNETFNEPEFNDDTVSQFLNGTNTLSSEDVTTYTNPADSTTSAQLPDLFNPVITGDYSVGSGEQTGYTGTEQGDTNMDDFEWNQLADIFDMTNGADPYTTDGWNVGSGAGVGIGDLDWQQALDIFDLTGGDDPYNLDGFDFGDLITDGDSRGFGGNDIQWEQDADIFDLTDGGDPYNNGGTGFGSESSTTNGSTSGPGTPGVLGSVKDAVTNLLGGGAAGSANAALIYELLKALMKSKQGDTGNRISSDSVNMVVNAGEKGAPTRTGTNFGAPRTAVGNVPQLAPTSNGVFQLGLKRN